MPTLEELLRYKYGDSQTPDDILRRLESINLQNKKNAKAIPTTPAGDRIVPTQEDDSPYGKLERGIFEGLQKYGPSTFQDPYRANQTAGALTDVLSMTPGPAEIMDHRQGNYLMEEGRPVAGLGYQAMAALPFIPANRVRRAIPDNMGGGSTPTPPPVDKPTAKPMRFDVEERGEEMYFEQYNRGLNHQSPVADTLDTFSDEYVWNQEEMYKKLRSTRPAVTTLEKAIEEMPGFDSPDKKYSMQEMLNLARKHGIEGSRKNTYNQNVLSQIEEFTKTLAETSPNKVANLSEKMTKQELLDLINKNNPRFSETRTTYSGQFTNDFFSRDMPQELAYTYHSPFVPLNNAPRTVFEATERKMPDLTINSQFAINSRLAGDPETFVKLLMKYLKI